MFARSMTGFARKDGQNEFARWGWEVRSVNGRGLDIRCRLPSGFEEWEGEVKTLVSRFCRRGSLTLSLSLEWLQSLYQLRINTQILDPLLILAQELHTRHGLEAASVDGMLAIKGVTELSEIRNDTAMAGLRDQLREDLVAALKGLQNMRLSEGQLLVVKILDRISRVEMLSLAAKNHAAKQAEHIRERLLQQIEVLLPDGHRISDERLAQEVVLLITKADIQEELDRLAAHCVAMRTLLQNSQTAEDGIGRKLDFICQELHREANTLCAKSADKELTGIGIDLKTTIDQLREQIQNIE